MPFTVNLIFYLKIFNYNNLVCKLFLLNNYKFYYDLNSTNFNSIFCLKKHLTDGELFLLNNYTI